MSLSFLKTGAASAALAAQQALEAEQRRENQGKLIRFWLKDDKDEARITFVDGLLGPEGYLIPPRWYEHNLFLNGAWFNFFTCPERTNPEANDPCPIDESGDYPYLAAGFTIIDHRQYKSQKTDKVYTNTKKLLVAKPQSFELLNKIAMKRGGLAGCTFDVSKIGDKAASIGSMYDFVEKKPIEELEKLYMMEVVDPKTNAKTNVTYFKPAIYEEEIVYRTGLELRKLGLGKPSTMSMNVGGVVTGNTDYSKQL